MIKIYNRLKKLEQRLSPADDGAYTLEELCRSMWLSDKKHFLDVAKDTTLSLFATQFELDDAERRQTKRVFRNVR